MYNTIRNSRTQINVSVDKGYLRLQFPSFLSQKLYGKKQLYKGLGRKDSSENREWAERIAARIQADLDHPDSANLFDPTLEKYFDVKVNNILPHPISKTVKLKDIWFDFIEYKLKIGEISETTYRTRYNRTFKNWLQPFLEDEISHDLSEKIVHNLLEAKVNKANLKKLLSALKDASDRAINKGIINRNYFVDLGSSIKTPKRSRQMIDEEDFRAYSLQEREIIIEAFRQSRKKSEKQIADLVEFLFLTGCRLGEVFALKWSDIKSDWIVFDESYSSETKITKSTKTDTIRIFRTKGYTRLVNLLEQVRSQSRKNSEYVFTSYTGKQYDRFKLCSVWLGHDKSKGDVEYYYPGVVSRLVKEGRINQYLKPSATRHTFITIQAHNGTDLKLLADSVGNSVDVIYNHYLGVNKDATIANI